MPAASASSVLGRHPHAQHDEVGGDGPVGGVDRAGLEAGDASRPVRTSIEWRSSAAVDRARPCRGRACA